MKQNLQALEINQDMPEIKDEAQMILPVHLNTLLEILPTQMLLVDLRTSSEFEKSHIHGAINLRMPLSFARQASFDMMERAFTDDQSRRKFSSWQSSRCMVFYDRATESALECPIADTLLQKFRGWGWDGQCFILKGHYREFSDSYSKYIVGIRMTQEAKDYVDSLRERAASRQQLLASLESYKSLLSQLNNEGRVHGSTMTLERKLERAKGVESHQRDLEAEFQRRFPELYNKAREVHGGEETPPAFDPAWLASTPGGTTKGKDNFDTKAPLVEYLDRGLTKMRDARPTTSPSPSRAPGHSKLDMEGYFDAHAERPGSGEYVQVGKGDGPPADDPGFGGAKPSDGSSGGDDAPKKGGRGGFLSKVLRRA